MSSWKIYNKNKKFEYFDEAEEKEWKGPFYFIQGADIQFGFISRELEKKEVITWEEENKLARNIVDRINQMNPKPRFFVMCGDLCDAFPDTEPEMRKMQEADYKEIFSKLDKDIPLVCVCGNHDVGNTPTHETVQMYRSSFGDDYFSFWCGGILFLVLNSQYFYDPSKVQSVAKDHCKWIKTKLEEAKKEKKRVVVFQHIPWFLKSFEEEASYFTISFEVRKIWLEEFKNAGVEAVFCGHYHRNAGGIYDGIDIVVTSAVGVAEKFNDDAVEELESLKKGFNDVESRKSSGEEVTVSKTETSFFSDVNGHKSNHKETTEEVNRNGKLLGKILEKVDSVKSKNGKPISVTETEMEIPLKGIHKVFFKNNAKLKDVPEKKQTNSSESEGSEDEVDVIKLLSSIKYSPLFMAEYIFWTGDEKTVALAVEEFLEEGLMTRQEAINFLQSVKLNLDFMQAHYQNLQRMVNKVSGDTNTKLKREFLNPKSFMKKSKETDNQPEGTKLAEYNLQTSKPNSFEMNFPATKGQQYPCAGEIGKNELNGKRFFERTNESDYGSIMDNKGTGVGFNDDYEEMMEKLKVSDFLHKEYSLEEFIFRLARVMFSRNPSDRNEETLQLFLAYLLNKVEYGQISKNLEKKILDVLVTALMETLTEHPELIDKAKEELQNLKDQSSSVSKC